MTVIHRLPARRVKLGAGEVRRLLPKAACRQVGPWVFLDHFGPETVKISPAMDVRPHPHVGLSTVTFLFDGAIEHRDSGGGHAVVRPNEIHWMRAGHGIVHSERMPRDLIGKTATLAGLQLWCAHPDGAEEQDPAFGSWTDLPELDHEGVRVQLLAGNGWAAESPVDVTSNLVYAIAHLRAGQRLLLPDHQERCIYPVRGEVAVDGEQTRGELLVLDGAARQVVAVDDAVVAILGGDRIGKRYIWWNLVHSDRARLRELAERWERREFPTIPGDDEEFIPAPPFA